MQKSTLEKITHFLYELSIPAHASGYGCLRDAIAIAIENFGAVHNMIRFLYPAVAAKNDYRPSYVLRSIHNTIDEAFQRDAAAFEKCFGNMIHGSTPKNAEFIAMAADAITLDIAATNRKNKRQNKDLVKIADAMNELGVPAHILGRVYLRDAIAIAIENFEAVHNMMGVLYPAVAAKNDTKPDSVGRAMRQAIAAAFGCNRSAFMKYFSNTINHGNAPSCSEFIAMIAETISLNSSGDGLLRRITDTLHELGIPAHLSGCGYLRDAVALTIENSWTVDDMPGVLYPAVAAKSGIRPSRVNRVIFNVILVAFKSNGTVFEKYFGSTASHGAKPENLEFIAKVANAITLDTGKN